MLPLRRLELRRHARKGTLVGGDSLSPEGIQQAYELGRSLRIGYTHLYTSGAQRATQTLACILAGMGRPVASGVVVRPGLGSIRETDWRTTVRAAGSANLDDLLRANGSLIRDESKRLADEIVAMFADLPEGAYGLAIGHTPLLECAIFGLTNKAHKPLAECEGFVVVRHKSGRFEVEELRI